MATRAEYVEKMKRQLDEWNREIDGLEEKISAMTGPGREKLRSHLEETRKHYEAGKKKLGEIQAAGEATWEKVQDEAEHAWKVLKRSIKYFRSQL